MFVLVSVVVEVSVSVSSSSVVVVQLLSCRKDNHSLVLLCGGSCYVFS